jgi:hypothetical protein
MLELKRRTGARGATRTIESVRLPIPLLWQARVALKFQRGLRVDAKQSADH